VCSSDLLIQEYAATIRLPPRIVERGVKGFIATGGNIESIARIFRGDRNTPGPLTVSVEEVEDLVMKLSVLSVEERQKAYDLRPDRADVIIPAAIVFAHLARRIGASEIVAPGGGLREGIMFDLLARQAPRKEPPDSMIVDDGLALGRKYRFDEKHAQHVARLAVSLFDQLSREHGMGERDRRLLLAASLLHDIGGVVSLKSHHKHALYLLARSELPGFSPHEMYLVGCIARYHRKAPPTPLHHEFAQLTIADRGRVRLLAGLLRVADALDKEHQQKIQAIEVTRHEREVQIRAKGTDDVLLEQWALRKKDDLFREVFDMTVTFTKDGELSHG
jgi:exopolyphosphatase/guanosine-5'-triphosphate,3'-diphosphate pyrophosphatase